MVFKIQKASAPLVHNKCSLKEGVGMWTFVQQAEGLGFDAPVPRKLDVVL